MRWAASALALLAVAGCGSSSRAVLYAKTCRFDRCTQTSDAQARAQAAGVLARWKRDVATRGREAPSTRFPNLGPGVVRSRLAKLARVHGFDIVDVEFLRPRQLAPLVVVRTTHYEALARATSSILKLIDPKRPTGDDRTGWRFEGFFFEAQDERGIPFLATSNLVRGANIEGSQWARSEPLFPFAHG